MPRATTVRFSDEIFARLDQASARTGMPVNSIVVAACLEWMQRHTPDPFVHAQAGFGVPLPAAPRWATIRRAVERAAGRIAPSGLYPFERFTATSQKLLTTAQAEAQKAGFSYIGTEHLLLAALLDPAAHAGQVLAALGVTEEGVRPALEKKVLVGKGAPKGFLVPTSRVKVVIELAFDVCAAAGDTRVTTGHILVALANEGEGIASQVLNGAGATPEAIATAMEALTEPEP